VATAILVGRDLSAGERLLAELDRESFSVIAAFWRYPTGDSDWQLVIASPLVDEKGALPVYKRLQEALDRLREDRLFLREIVVVGEQDPVVRQLRETFASFAPEPFSISLTFPGFTPDAPYLSENDASVSLYVYRLVPGDPASGPKIGVSRAAKRSPSVLNIDTFASREEKWAYRGGLRFGRLPALVALFFRPARPPPRSGCSA
jgi:hypothetical protein